MSVEQADTTLRPGMTTGNVETLSIKDVLSVPLEAVTSEAGIPYVYKKSGASVVKQEVETGAMNDNEVVIVRGLDINDRVLLSPPAGQGQAERRAPRQARERRRRAGRPAMTRRRPRRRPGEAQGQRRAPVARRLKKG